MATAGSWQPGRLLVGWSLGVLMTLGLLTATGGWYEYRQLSTAPGSASSARRPTGAESACQVDKDAAIHVGGFEVVPDQSDGCYLRRPRIRPWQWSDGLQAELSRFSTTASRLGPAERDSAARTSPIGSAAGATTVQGPRVVPADVTPPNRSGQPVRDGLHAIPLLLGVLNGGVSAAAVTETAAP